MRPLSLWKAKTNPSIPVKYISVIALSSLCMVCSKYPRARDARQQQALLGQTDVYNVGVSS